jgi:hypothetical protein
MPIFESIGSSTIALNLHRLAMAMTWGFAYDGFRHRYNHPGVLRMPEFGGTVDA